MLKKRSDCWRDFQNQIVTLDRSREVSDGYPRRTTTRLVIRSRSADLVKSSLIAQPRACLDG